MPRRLEIRPGTPTPLGACWDGEGTNFAIYSEGATAVELALVDARGEETRVPVQQRTEHVWHVYVAGVGPGQRYAYYVDGPWEPQHGCRFNPATRLLDPYALAVDGVEQWDAGAFSYDLERGGRDADLVRNDRPQRAASLAVVIDRRFDWDDDAPPRVSMADAVIYEAHVKGLTWRHPHVDPAVRGTYGGVASDAMTRYLRDLGVTSVELLPVHHFVDDKFLLDKGLRNYWGYNTIGFFAPDPRYRAGGGVGDEVRQFKQMVKALHRAGLEVILDVVYNHTAEGNHLGPTFSLKGVDNRTYYRLVADSPRHYFDYTGTGNSLNVRHPQTLRLIMDSLRYWVEEMHVDGFRFDLASTLARSLHEVDPLSSFFVIINQDPVIGRAKLIAEPWDVGEGGYQVGGFPVGWSEWNGKFRDVVRGFWRGDRGLVSELGYRLTGSADLYQTDGRHPSSSVNLITAHDGFTLRDLVSYDHKHNEANGEDNRDGSDNEHSWNCGAEGRTDDQGVNRLRARQVRNFLTTLLLSQGTPMITAGDELGRTQQGNNNAYCQDTELSWLDWDLDDERRALYEFTRRLVRLRAEHPTFRRAGFFQGRAIDGLDVPDLVWLKPDGSRMVDGDWHDPATTCLGMYLAGAGVDRVDATGAPLADDDFLLVLNNGDAGVDVTLPAIHDRGAAHPWELVIDTDDDGAREARRAGEVVRLLGRSMRVYVRPAPGRESAGTVGGAASSTYRVQLHRGFTFADAAAIVDYLDALGVGALYTSPYTHAEPGSTHGYNVVDHAAINPELGGADAHAAMIEALRARDLGHVLDFVPNHVGVGAGHNRWWNDVLENGPASRYADHFDIDWRPPAIGLDDKVLLPVLGNQYGQELEDGKLAIVREGGRFFVTYYDRRWPAAPRSVRPILAGALGRLELPADDARRWELESILTGLEHLPPADGSEPERREERAREKEVLKRRLGALAAESAEVAAALDEELASINLGPGSAGDPDRLDALLRDQNFRLAYWRVATEEINYRRFFDINELAAIRMEDPRVFDATHALVLDLLARGDVTGLRLDHTDGLYEPAAYFAALQARAREAIRAAGREPPPSLYVVAEKILEPGERLPRSWAIAGTSGYDFIAAVNGLWIDGAAEAPMTRFYAEYTGDTPDVAGMVFDTKLLIMETSLSGEVVMLGQALRRLAEGDRRSRDFTLATLTRAIRATIAAFPVYRTYITPAGTREPNDEAHVDHAIALAKRRTRNVDASAFDYLRDVLLLRVRTPAAVHFAMRFQQLTGPVMAKGVEDTAMYRYGRLIALNEVGCDPARFGETIESFHEHNARTLAAFPLTMTTTTTHDTKRSEDVRTRLAVLTELPDAWMERVRRWTQLGDAHLTRTKAGAAPSRGDQYLFWQTVVGAWPMPGGDEALPGLTARLVAYMEKATREAKVHTSWTAPDAAYEAATRRFVERMMADAAFVDDVRALVGTIAAAGACNSLAQVALKLAAPGIADVYQGGELWDLSLVDPDNRRPVDYARRRALLAELGDEPLARAAGKGAPAAAATAAGELLAAYADGRIKLHVTRAGLRLRRRERLLFLEGSYTPIDAGDHVIAFERARGDRRLVCVVPRLPYTLTGGGARGAFPVGDVWGDARLPVGGAFVNVFTGARHEGEPLALRDVLATLPVAWLLA